MDWKAVLQTSVAVLLAFIVYGFLDKLVLSKMASHLENLIGGDK